MVWYVAILFRSQSKWTRLAKVLQEYEESRK